MNSLNDSNIEDLDKVEYKYKLYEFAKLYGLEKSVVMAYELEGDDFVKYIFERCPKSGGQSKPYYVMFNVLMESQGGKKRHRKFCYNKTNRHPSIGSIVLDYEMDPIEFYNQFTALELEAVGI